MFRLGFVPIVHDDNTSSVSTSVTTQDSHPKISNPGTLYVSAGFVSDITSILRLGVLTV
jgi:hypothetical protein